MKNFEKELYSKRREFGRNFIYSMLGVFLLYILFALWLQKIHPELPQVPIVLYILSFVATGYLGYLFSRTTFSFQTTYTIISSTCGCLIFYLCLLLCHVSTTIFYFYVPVILLVLLISDIKTTVIVTVFIILLSVFTKSLAEFFNISQPTSFASFNFDILNYIELFQVFLVSYLSFYILYYYNEIKKIEAKQQLFLTSNVTIIKRDINVEPTKTISKDDTEDKLYDLYQKILDCFDNEKPYQDPNFNIRKLTQLLDTNSTYISKSLNEKGNIKFNQLVNEYRINQVKKEIENNFHQKFTLEHIYTNAGFSQQSTFNRVFKEQTGITPSEYIENHHA